MNRRSLQFLFLALVFMFSLAACGNTEDENGGTDGDISTDGDTERDTEESPDGDETVDGDAETDGEMEETPAPLCAELTFDMGQPASGQVFITLTDMTAHYEDLTSYDLVFAKVHGQGPTGYLGDGVTAVNAGNEISFDDFEEAPADGYRTDGEDPVIGASWKDGGSGTEGFQTTGNIYVLKLKDGSFAKVAVTSAKDGVVTMDAFRRADGSIDLRCRFE